MSRLGNGIPEIGKFSTARWVCAPYNAWAGTLTSPIESFSTRNSAMDNPLKSQNEQREQREPWGWMHESSMDQVRLGVRRWQPTLLVIERSHRTVPARAR